MSSSESSYDRETDFVDSVGKVVDLVGEEVVGKGNTTKFVADIKADLAANKIDAAMQRCKNQKGSVCIRLRQRRR